MYHQKILKRVSEKNIRVESFEFGNFEINTVDNVSVDKDFFCFDEHQEFYYDFNINEYFLDCNWRECRLKNNQDLGFLESNVSLISIDEVEYSCSGLDNMMHSDVDVFIYDYSWGYNYQHWLLTSIPRLFLFKELKARYPELKVLHNPNGPSFKYEIFELLGIARDDIIYHVNLTNYKRVFSPSFIGGSGKTVSPTILPYFQRLRDDLGYKCTPENKIRLVYLGRDDAQGKRPLSNRNELDELLISHDFEKIDLSSLSLREKIKTFSEAKIIIGDFSAGWGHLVFCDEGTKAILLEHEIYHFESFYSELSKRIGCEFSIVNSNNFFSNIILNCYRLLWRLTRSFDKNANSKLWSVDLNQVKKMLIKR